MGGCANYKSRLVNDFIKKKVSLSWWSMPALEMEKKADL